MDLTFNALDQQLLLTDEGDFTWNFAQEFWIETAKGNFIWSNPDYMGNNTIRKATMSYQEWIGEGGFGRSKGRHIIGHYCGMEVTILQ